MLCELDLIRQQNRMFDEEWASLDQPGEDRLVRRRLALECWRRVAERQGLSRVGAERRFAVPAGARVFRFPPGRVLGSVSGGGVPYEEQR